MDANLAEGDTTSTESYTKIDTYVYISPTDEYEEISPMDEYEEVKEQYEHVYTCVLDECIFTTIFSLFEMAASS